jgi:DNA-binding MarR family transcriptional regulator
MARSTSRSQRASRADALLETTLLLFTVAERSRQHWGRCAGELGLSGAQAKVLLGLDAGEAMSMRALARRLDYDASNLSSLVDRLRALGLVEQRADPGDRRTRTLLLTEQGHKVREQLRSRITDVSAPLGAQETANVLALRQLLSEAIAGR